MYLFTYISYISNVYMFVYKATYQINTTKIALKFEEKMMETPFWRFH